MTDYKELVLRLSDQQKYPVLKDFVLLDVYYKTIPENLLSDRVRNFDRRYDDPLHVFAKMSDPFAVSYLAGSPSSTHFTLHQVDPSSSSFASGPLDFQRVKLKRSWIDDTVLQRPSPTFEHELCEFLKLLNFDVPRIASILDLDDIRSTRFLPQFVRLWAFDHALCPIRPNTSDRLKKKCFGPVADEERSGVLPVRVLRGRLAPCRSTAVILSLNDDVAYHDDGGDTASYVLHYVERWNAVVPLAFNPLENPILTTTTF